MRLFLENKSLLDQKVESHKEREKYEELLKSLI